MGVVGQLISALSCERRRTPQLSEKAPEENFSEKAAERTGLEKPDEAAKALAKELKEKGNEHFRRQEFEEALDAYAESAEKNLYDASVWLNRSICQRKLERWDDAATDAEVACELDPSNGKAFYSRSLALQKLEKLDEALKICKQGLKKSADNKALQQLSIDLQKDIAQAKIVCPGEAGKVQAACPAESMANVAANNAELVQELVEEMKSDGSGYQWKGPRPDARFRREYKESLVGMFRSKYEELKRAASEAKSKRTALQTDQYEANQKQALQLTGGHRPMERPEHVDLPADYMKPVGKLTPQELAEFGCDNADRRFMLSVYGNIFDVSDRPDKYSAEGPYASLTGKDLTWGLFAGVDTVDYTNKFYDLFKAKDQGKDKLSGLCSWLAWYSTEYGAPIGQLTPWLDEEKLPDPPLHEIEEACVVM